jgi:hypothetical protein
MTSFEEEMLRAGEEADFQAWLKSIGADAPLATPEAV